MVKALLVAVVLAAAACGQQGLTPAPSGVGLDIRDVTYAINIPDSVTAQALVVEYPNGVQTAPVDAQRVWDYAAAYGGAPNVYYGPVAPPVGMYVNAGIVVAPLNVASEARYFDCDWPPPGGTCDPNRVYRWLGRFVYTRASATEIR